VSYVHLRCPIPKLVGDVVNYGAVPSTPDESEAEKGQFTDRPAGGPSGGPEIRLPRALPHSSSTQVLPKASSKRPQRLPSSQGVSAKAFKSA
jgi:hypothetical protein